MSSSSHFFDVSSVRPEAAALHLAQQQTTGAGIELSQTSCQSPHSLSFAQSNFNWAVGFGQTQKLLVLQLRVHGIPGLEIEHNLAEC